MKGIFSKILTCILIYNTIEEKKMFYALQKEPIIGIILWALFIPCIYIVYKVLDIVEYGIVSNLFSKEEPKEKPSSYSHTNTNKESVNSAVIKSTPVRTPISNITQPNYYTAEELLENLTLDKVDITRIPPALKGHYKAYKIREEQLKNDSVMRSNLYTAEELLKICTPDNIDKINELRIPPAVKLVSHIKTYYSSISQPQQDKPSAPQKDYYQMRKNISKGYWKVTPEQIRAMDWREFEQFIANLFTEQGYKTTLTPAQHDEGKDVIAEKDGKIYYIECKHWKEDSVIGRELLQKLVGAAMSHYNVTNVIFIATCRFHDNAKNYAKEVNFAGRIHIELWNIHRLLKEANAVPNAQLKTSQPKQ